MMKRYAAFAFLTYYPSGGFEDLVGVFDSVDEAKAAADAHHRKEESFGPQGHVADMQEEKIVCYVDEDGWHDGDPRI